MKILALEASANTVSVCVTDGAKLTGEYTINHKKTHSQTLMPMIEELLKTLELSLDEIDLIAVSKGPGSFTGLRIGVETAKALSHGANKPIAGVDTVFAMAHNFCYADSDMLIAPIMDARRNQVYTGLFRAENGKIKEEMKTCAIGIDTLVSQIKKSGKNALFLGDGVLVHKEFLEKELGEKAFFAPPNNNMQKASSVAIAAESYYENKEYDTYLSLLPEYLRVSQAEREYNEKNKKGE